MNFFETTSPEQEGVSNWNAGPLTKENSTEDCFNVEALQSIVFGETFENEGVEARELKYFALPPASRNPSDFERVNHISGNVAIVVSKRRKERILKRRAARKQFLLQFPRYSLPYQFRGERTKVQSRVHATGSRKRTSDGKFKTRRDDLMMLEPERNCTVLDLFGEDIQLNCPQ